MNLVSAWTTFMGVESGSCFSSSGNEGERNGSEKDSFHILGEEWNMSSSKGTSREGGSISSWDSKYSDCSGLYGINGGDSIISLAMG